MKIYKSCYRSHWISPLTILEYVFFWTEWSRCARNASIQTALDEANGKFKFVEPPEWVDRWADRLNPISQAIQWFLDKIHPRIDYVKIDRWDTWSMDHTLADIILPMLKQLQATKHGSPFVDDEDVPEYLRSTEAEPKENEWDTDSLHHERWDWVLSEMIWAFEQKTADDAEGQFFEHEQGPEMPAGREARKQWIEDFNERARRMKYDEAGHRAWQARKANGFRLMGKYWEALWD